MAAPELSADAEGPKSDVRDTFEYWRTKLGHPKARLDGKRERAIRGALKLYSKEDLCKAVDGCGRSDFHMGRDPKTNGRRFDDIELICRDAKHVEGFMAQADSKAATPALQQAYPRRDQPNQPNMGLTGLEIFDRKKATVSL